MSIPKSIVARIDRDGFGYSCRFQRFQRTACFRAARGSRSVGMMTWRASSSTTTRLISAISRKWRRTLVPAAPLAIEKVAAAHYAAAQFLDSKGDTHSAIDHYREALSFAPDNLGLAAESGGSLLAARASSPRRSTRWNTRGSIAPDSPDVAKLDGWAYYGANKMDQAVAEWQRAEKLRPDAEVERALEKAERDKAEEESYREGETAHFVLKYNGSATPDLARGILHVLEDDFRDLESQLDFTPPDPIGVILYTGQSFADITRAPSWVGALNDGRIRIPVQGLTSVTPELARELKHELTHSFIGQKTHNRAPTWLQEGVAQYMEGRRTIGIRRALC